MTLQEKLKAATQLEHDQLEQLMYVGQIMSKTLTIDQYKRILSTNYLIHATHEKQLFSLIPVDFAKQIELNLREKLSALEKDLLQVNLTPGAVVSEHQMTWSSWSALGALYVLEGATMGGKVIYKQLLANHNFAEHQLDLNYYTIYGDQLMPNWKTFIGVLNDTPEEHHDEAVAGAKLMFKEIAEAAKQTE